MNDIVINKIQSIQRSVKRAREEYNFAPEEFRANFTRQDAAILNVLRACESAIDLANHVIRAEKLGIPTSTAESFHLLAAARLIDADLAESMGKMVGFRNTVVHQYTQVDIEIVISVITIDLGDVLKFADAVRVHAP